MAWEHVHVDDYGQVCKLRAVKNGVAEDISSYTTRQFIFEAPDGTNTPKTAAFVTDGTDGYLQYIIENGLIDTAGNWQVQMRLSKSGAVLTSNAHLFPVWARLD